MATTSIAARGRGRRIRRGVGATIAGVFGALKIAKVLGFLLTVAKLGKLGGSLITMLITIGVYSMVFGWRYAAGFVILIAIHEAGHFIAARHRGLDVSAPTFIPFVGAAIQLREQPMDVETEAFVGAAGPVLGTAAALAVYAAALHTGSHLLLALAYSGLMINFFNLIPLHPLDGGRITAIVSPRIWFVGAPIMVALTIWWRSPLLLLITILCIPSLVKAWRHDMSDPETARYYGVPMSMRIGYGTFYLALVAFLGVMTTRVDGMLQALRASHGL